MFVFAMGVLSLRRCLWISRQRVMVRCHTTSLVRTLRLSGQHVEQKRTLDTETRRDKTGSGQSLVHRWRTVKKGDEIEDLAGDTLRALIKLDRENGRTGETAGEQWKVSGVALLSMANIGHCHLGLVKALDVLLDSCPSLEEANFIAFLNIFEGFARLGVRSQEFIPSIILGLLSERLSFLKFLELRRVEHLSLLLWSAARQGLLNFTGESIDSAAVFFLESVLSEILRREAGLIRACVHAGNLGDKLKNLLVESATVEDAADRFLLRLLRSDTKDLVGEGQEVQALLLKARSLGVGHLGPWLTQKVIKASGIPSLNAEQHQWARDKIGKERRRRGAGSRHKQPFFYKVSCISWVEEKGARGENTDTRLFWSGSAGHSSGASESSSDVKHTSKGREVDRTCCAEAQALRLFETFEGGEAINIFLYVDQVPCLWCLEKILLFARRGIIAISFDWFYDEKRLI